MDWGIVGALALPFFARRTYHPIYTPHFVKFPNKSVVFARFFEPVYWFTLLYPKNVRQALFGADLGIDTGLQ